jgi:adenosylhomocysteine nucleosidase
MKLLLVASDRMEFAGILSHVRHPRAAGVAVDWARWGQLDEYEVLLAANGIGGRRAGAAVDGAARFHPDAVISTGFCGALDPALDIADIVVGTSVGGHPCLPVTSGVRLVSGPIASGSIASIDHIVRMAEEKRRLRAGGARAVEMEAAGVAQRARALGLPFYCVKAVSDLAGEDMANDFNAALRSDGHFDTIVIFRGVLRHPIVRIPELFRLRGRCVRAARALGEFFADCRF